MKARRLIEGASFGPDELKAIGKAFDEAWQQLAPGISNRPEAVEAARLKLANVVLGLAKRGVLDSQELADAAIAAMFDQPTKLRS